MKIRKNNPILFVLLILFQFGCTEKLDKKLYSMIDEKYKKNNCEINFNDIISEKWEYMFIVEEFITPSEISSAIGFKYSGNIVLDGEYRLIITNRKHILRDYSFSEPRFVFSQSNNAFQNKTGITKIEINDTFCAQYITSVRPNFYSLKKR